MQRVKEMHEHGGSGSIGYAVSNEQPTQRCNTRRTDSLEANITSYRRGVRSHHQQPLYYCGVYHMAYLRARACLMCSYRYDWKVDEARKNILRTHTTAVSARMLYEIANVSRFSVFAYDPPLVTAHIYQG